LRKDGINGAGEDMRPVVKGDDDADERFCSVGGYGFHVAMPSAKERGVIFLIAPDYARVPLLTVLRKSAGEFEL
jgi:hypothetical protein